MFIISIGEMDGIQAKLLWWHISHKHKNSFADKHGREINDLSYQFFYSAKRKGGNILEAA